MTGSPKLDQLQLAARGWDPAALRASLDVARVELETNYLSLVSMTQRSRRCWNATAEGHS